VPSGVLEEVAHQPLELRTVAPDPAARDVRRVDAHVRRRAVQPRRLRQNEVVEVDGLRSTAQRPFVGPRQEQEVLDETLEPQVLLEHDLGQLVETDPIGMGDGDLGVLADGGHG
jgi:hypothetical protein